MNIELRRVSIPSTLNAKQSLDGSLYINGQYICDTAENRLTALPAGKYRIIRHYCHQYNRFMPLVQRLEFNEERLSIKEFRSTLNFQRSTFNCSHCPPQKTEDKEVSLNTIMPCYCPMLKPGNGVHHREDGSIILGTQVIPGCLSHPLQAFEPLAERIRKAIKRNKVITLIIQPLPPVIQRSIATKDLENIKQ